MVARFCPKYIMGSLKSIFSVVLRSKLNDRFILLYVKIEVRVHLSDAFGPIALFSLLVLLSFFKLFNKEKDTLPFCCGHCSCHYCFYLKLMKYLMHDVVGIYRGSDLYPPFIGSIMRRLFSY